MSKEATKKLTKYLELLKNKIEQPIPAKHVNHPESYLAFLHKDLKATQAKLDALKLEGGK